MADASDWINLGLLLIAIAAAGFAWWQAAEARKNRLGAEQALTAASTAADAAVRQADAAERSVRIQERMLQPAPWSASHHAGDTYKCVNTSGRTIIVRDISWKPDGSKMLLANVAPDNRYEDGDRFEFAFAKGWPSAPHKLTVRWEWEDGAEGEPYTIRL